MVALAPWPTWDPVLVEEEVRILPVQINGKRRGEVRAPAGASAADVEKLVFDNAEIAKRLEGLTVRKFIVVTDRIVNVVVD
jgi:leucyl-tRNA synthetase